MSGPFSCVADRIMMTDIELARSNMVENQVRTWEVLDARVLEAQDELHSFRRFQAMPQHRASPVEHQLRRFLGTRATRKIRSAQRLVEALDLERLPHPLAQLAARLPIS